ncbi:MAG: acyltransferase family protein [Actinomycetia bacterium]|nr:acyltransferase family protein [Actinomycetes bacterium]
MSTTDERTDVDPLVDDDVGKAHPQHGKDAPGDEPAAVSPAPAHTSLPHQPALDGLRGIAVAAVVLYHGAAANGIGWLEPVTKGGYLGVSAFFTLSGFLIASLLLEERRSTDGVSLAGFWERRARRLLPAVLVTIAAVLLLTPIIGTASQLASLPGDALASLFYVANWRFVFDGSDYSAMFAGDPSPLRHVWSLAVEEQWYVLVPLAALLVARTGWGRPGRRRRDLTLLLTAVTVGATAWMVLVSAGSWDNRAYMGTDTRLAEMTVGAVAATLLGRRFAMAPRGQRRMRHLAPLALVALLVAWAFTPITASWLYRGGLTLHAVVVAALLVAVVQPRGAARWLLSRRPLAALGRVSYAVYLFHWPIIWWLGPDRLGIGPTAAFAVQVCLTLVLAAISLWLLERPIRSRRVLLGYRGWAAMFAAFAIVIGLVATLPEPERSEVIALGSGVDVAIPTTTVAPATPSEPDTAVATTAAPPPPPMRIMVVGDSFAESILIGLQRWALTDGGAAVMDATIPACAFGRGGSNKGVGIRRTESQECRNRDAMLTEALTSFDPELVLVAGGMWDVTDRKPSGFRRWTRIGNQAYDEYLFGELSHLVDVLAAGGQPVLWANSPHWDPVPGSVIFMGHPPYSEADPARADAYNDMLAALDTARPEVEVLDIAAWMNSQPGGEFDPALRPDGVHFSEASTDVVAAWLGPALLERYRS